MKLLSHKEIKHLKVGTVLYMKYGIDAKSEAHINIFCNDETDFKYVIIDGKIRGLMEHLKWTNSTLMFQKDNGDLLNIQIYFYKFKKLNKYQLINA